MQVILLDMSVLIPHHAAFSTAVALPRLPPLVANSINNLDQIVGYFINGGVYYGFIFDGETYTTLSIDCYDTFANGINDAGQVVGYFNETTTPLPTSLPLSATGLGGLGLLGWRRKRKAVA
jgi:hypothetical protein